MNLDSLKPTAPLAAVELLKSQRAEVFRALEANRLDPSTVQWTTMGHPSGIGEVPALKVNETEFFFAFADQNGRRIAVYSPGPETLRHWAEAANWPDMLYHLGMWVQLVRREMAAPDPWAELERQVLPLVFDPKYPASQTPFDKSEVKAVTQALGGLRELLLEYAGTNKQQQKAILAGIQRLEVSAKIQDRSAFFYTVVGFIYSTAVSMALAPEQTKNLFECIKNGLAGILRLVG